MEAYHSFIHHDPKWGMSQWHTPTITKSVQSGTHDLMKNELTDGVNAAIIMDTLFNSRVHYIYVRLLR